MKIILFIITIMFISFLSSCTEDPATVDEQNHPPVIASLVANPDTIKTGATTALTCNATDSDGDNLTFVWNAQSGTINGSASNANWVAPNAVGAYYVSCKVVDGNGGEDDDSVNIVVEQQLPTQGLIAYYPFNGNANDESGNGNNGNVFGTTLTADRFGNANAAYSFNGTSNFIRINDSPSLDIGTNITITAWRIMTSSSWGRMIRKVNTWGTPSGGYILTAGNNYINSELQLNTNPNNVTIVRKDTTLSLNTWYFIAMTYDGTAVSLFLDGSKIYSEPHTGTINLNNYPVYIGSSEGVEYFEGMIDDIRIYNRALTVNEIQQLFGE